MKITLIPGEAEEDAPTGDICTEIESDGDYRKRLLALAHLKHDVALLNVLSAMSGGELDKIGKLHNMIRIHTYVSPR